MNNLFLLMLLFAAGISAARWGPFARRTARRENLSVLFVLLAFFLFDWGLLAALPVLKLSYGPVGSPLVGITLVRLLIFFILLLSLSIVKLTRSKPATPQRELFGFSYGLLVLLALNSGVAIAEIDGLYIEPSSLRLSQVHLDGPELIPGKSLRILHLSDLHIERSGPREHRLLELIEETQPDLIVLTGDYPNIDYKHDLTTLADTRALLSQLSAPYGVYAIPGTPAVDTALALGTIFDGLEITLLQDNTHHLVFESGDIYILGISNLGYDRDRRVLEDLMSNIPRDSTTMLLYHKPDLAEQADALGVDLYLSGHTHGGQIRLPFYGALITGSRFGKAYESGLYSLGHTHLYVSRGIGMEGLGMPRARFLCPPEAVLIQLGLGRSS